ncbi:MAG TPA: SDR family oxidoreductase, partial [Ramlibacter sp.]|nr:SDR family oxidoreductase [Ramlibacter sp.]
RYYDINLRTTFRLSREAVAAFGDQGGSIVNTASTVALVGMPGMAPYSAAKAAVVGLTRQMAAEYGRRGIRVNAVAPGLIETPATAARIRDHAFEDAVTRARPLARVGVPLDVARAFLFFASEESSFITGTVLPVCGGWSTTRFREARA